jgi:hypothetical protein
LSFAAVAFRRRSFGSTERFTPTTLFLLGAMRGFVLEWRDAPVMHGQIETPAFAGVSLAGL